MSAQSFLVTAMRLANEPLLEGLPEGTVVVYSIGEGERYMDVALRTGNNVTEARLELYEAARNLGTSWSLLDWIGQELRRLRKRHYLATYNVYPGWRL